MRLLVMSDIHLEFGPFELPASLPNFDVAIFAGDIGQPAAAAVQWIAQQRRGPLRARPVIYVPGNHEFYKTEMTRSLAQAKETAAALGINLLFRSIAIIEGVRFLGCVLWTDYRLYGTPKPSMVFAGQTLNDHRLIRYQEVSGHVSRFMPWHAAAEHRMDLAFIRHELATAFDGATVVVTHHAPHRNSIARRYKGSPLTPAFASDLSSIIAEYEPDLWVHGHDHGSHDYWVGRTHIVANQAGYPNLHGDRENKGFDPQCIIEIVTSPLSGRG